MTTNPTPPADRAALRDRIADGLREARKNGLGGMTEAEAVAHMADAVLAVLPAPADEVDADTVANRAAHVISAMGAEIRELKRERTRYRVAWHNARRRAGVLSAEVTRRAPLLGEYATEIARLRRELAASERIRENADFHLGQEMARRQRAEKETTELRRMADETATTETPEWARPETEEEKLAKARRMAKALSAPPVAPPEWATTTEWPGRHKRPGDRRVHATARFVISGRTQQFWTACGEHVGRSGTPLSHMSVDCRDCKRATAARARQDGAQPSPPPA